MAESCRRVLEIEIPLEVVKGRMESIASRFQRGARVPGFRPGRVPLSLIRERFQGEIRAELLRELVPEYVQVQAKEHNWEPIGNPTVSDIEYIQDHPLKFKATLEVIPEFQLEDWESLQVEVPQVEVSEEEVERALSQMREEWATFINLDTHPLEDGDFVSIDLKETLIGAESAGVSASNRTTSGGGRSAKGIPVQNREVLCEIGGVNTLKDFSENLKGAEVGEERNFVVSYPQDFANRRLAGKTVSYQVKVLGLKKKQLPELNDEFARELGEYNSLEDVREHLRKDLWNAKQQQSEEYAKGQLRKKLVQLHDFPVPEVLVARQTEKRMDRLTRQFEADGLDPKIIDWGAMQAAQRELAEEDVKSSLILERIFEINNLAVANADVEKEIQKIATVTRQSPEVVEAHLTNDGGLDKIKSRLRTEKALNFVFLNVRKVPIRPS